MVKTAAKLRGKTAKLRGKTAKFGGKTAKFGGKTAKFGGKTAKGFSNKKPDIFKKGFTYIRGFQPL